MGSRICDITFMAVCIKALMLFAPIGFIGNLPFGIYELIKYGEIKPYEK